VTAHHKSPFNRLPAAPEILSTRAFRNRFFQSLQRRPNELIIVSPFISTIPGFKKITHFARFVRSRDDATLLIVTRPPTSGRETITFEEATVLESLGVDLRIRTRPLLHSKVYRFQFSEGDYSAFVGSANLTIGGFERNDESVALFRDPGHRKTVDKEVDRLTSYGAFPFNSWKARISRKVD